MNEDGIRVAIGVIWAIYFLVFVWLTWGLWRLARVEDGSVLQWPVPGRYVLSIFTLLFAINCLDVVRIRLHWHVLEPYWSTTNINSWPTLLIRAAPLPFLIWVSLRIQGGGLIRPKARIPWDGIEQRMTIRREEDRELLIEIRKYREQVPQ